MSNLLTHPLTRTPRKRNRGGQPGNSNFPRNTDRDFLHVRCLGKDKGKWTKAANAAVKRGELEPDIRGNLASWVVKTLNEAVGIRTPKPQLLRISTAAK